MRKRDVEMKRGDFPTGEPPFVRYAPSIRRHDDFIRMKKYIKRNEKPIFAVETDEFSSDDVLLAVYAIDIIACRLLLC